MDSQNQATIQIVDFKYDQYIVVNGTFKLNDFNECVFRPREINNTCGRLENRNRGRFGVYNDLRCLGGTFYNLMEDPKMAREETARMLENGTFINHRRPVDVAVIHAIKMCFDYRDSDGYGARKVADFLERAYQTMQMEQARLR